MAAEINQKAQGIFASSAVAEMEFQGRIGGENRSFTEIVSSVYLSLGLEICTVNRNLFEEMPDNTPGQNRTQEQYRLGAAAVAFGVLLPLLIRSPFDASIDAAYMAQALQSVGFTITTPLVHPEETVPEIDPAMLDKDPLAVSFFLPDELGNYSLMPTDIQNILKKFDIWEYLTKRIVPEYVNTFLQLAWDYRIQHFPNRMGSLAREIRTIADVDAILGKED